VTNTAPKPLPRRTAGPLAGLALAGTILIGLGVAAFALWSLGRPSGTTGPSTPQGAGARAVSGTPGVERTLVATPEALRGILESVGARLSAQDAPGAEGILRAAITQYAEDQDLRVALAEVLLQQDRPADAYDQYVAALAIGPRDAPLEHRSGLLAVQLSRFDRALEHFAAAQTAQPSNPEYALLVANEQLRAGDHAAAAAGFLRVTVMDPDSALAFGSLARAELAMNRANLAAQHAARARQFEPDEPAWRLIEARALVRTGQAELALALVAPLTTDARAASEALSVAGQALGMLSRPAEAAALWTEHAQMFPADAAAAFEAAQWHRRAGDAAAASRWAAEAARRGHPNAGAWAAGSSD
jgi:tetratricopeptide (TPR) repeat protein